jgi:hypothetical protein
MDDQKWKTNVNILEKVLFLSKMRLITAAMHIPVPSGEKSVHLNGVTYGTHCYVGC